ncbi:exo-alpha-sialidase [Microlunatus ginsengisoli]|uniref:Exo-alpha-sialidase n=2 Tax=Microlunatus ginsengisoli TaxID=363863 RepID=A0ABP7AL24_9ACTN
MALSRGFRCTLALAAAGLTAMVLTSPAGAVGPGKKLHPLSLLTTGTHATIRAQEQDSDEAESIQQRAEFEQSIAAAPAETAPTAGLMAATQTANSLAVSGGTWRPVTNKPFLNDPIARGANYGEGYGLITGRMTSFTSAGRYVYAGSASGGVWRSSDNGAHWRTVNRGLPRLAVGALATNSRDGSVWVGTGEANNASENQYGTGIYRLARGSDHWARVGGTELYGAGVHRIAWIRGYVYAATSHGLYRRSVSSARTSGWRPVLQPAGPQLYPPSSDVTDIIAVPGSRGRQVLAVVGWSGYSDPPQTQYNGFYVGTGGRGSFNKIVLSGDLDSAAQGRTTFSSSHGWLYAVVSDTETGDLRGEGAFVSRSGRPGGPWVRIADVDKLAASGSALGDSTSSYYPGVQADYNQYILADPGNRRHVYLLLEEVFESTDGGATWLAVAPYWNTAILSCNPTGDRPYACPPTTHSDQHAAMIRHGQFWTGNDGGVWRRPLSWHQRGRWTDLNATLYTLQNYSVAVGKVGRGLAYWAGVQDSGEPYTRTDMSQVEQAFTGDGGDTIVDPNDGNKAVEEYVFLDMFLTTDGAVNTLTEISPSCFSQGTPIANCDPSPRFIAPIEQDVINPNHWVAGGRYVWDDTKSWATVCGPSHCDWQQAYDTGQGHSITGLAANGNVTYAAWCGPCNPGDANPFVRGMATNYGGTWHQLSLSQLPNRYITSIAVDPANAAHVYASVGSYSRRWIPDAGVGHVFESVNGGASWTDISGQLPDAPVYKVVLHGSDLVVGTEVGVFVGHRSSVLAAAVTTSSATARPRWQRLGKGLPKVTVWDLAVGPNGQIEAGTHGRGTWELARTSR